MESKNRSSHSLAVRILAITLAVLLAGGTVAAILINLFGA